MSVPKTLTEIIAHIKTIANDVPADLEARIETDVQRAQEDAEDYWPLWPFLHSEITFDTVQYQYAQAMEGSNVGADISARFLRWRVEARPWYVYDGIQKPVEIEWSEGPVYDSSDLPSPGARGDLQLWRTKDDVTTQAGAPRYIGIGYDAIGSTAGGSIETPERFFIEPPTDLGPAAAPGVYELHLPVSLREPQLSVSGSVTENYWTRRMARYLENKAVANLLATNQDPRYVAYESMAARDLAKHKVYWKRQLYRQGTPLRHMTDVKANRTTERL